MSTYKHILVPTDFSAASKQAAAKALELGRTFGARISLMHVVDYLPPTFITQQSEYTSAAQIVERATTYLGEWAKEVGLDKAEQLVVSGSAGKEIRSAAQETGVDLIAIGTVGQGGVSRLLGSTTRSVMHDAPCDVLSIKCE